MTGECACGSPFPRIDILIGRSADLVKVKGVNIYPGQIEDCLLYTSQPAACLDEHLDFAELEGRSLPRRISWPDGSADAFDYGIADRVPVSYTHLSVSPAEPPNQVKRGVCQPLGAKCA